MTDLERITTENNLGIYGDAQDVDELVGRGITLVGTLLHVLDEAVDTIARLGSVAAPVEVRPFRRYGEYRQSECDRWNQGFTEGADNVD